MKKFLTLLIFFIFSTNFAYAEEITLSKCFNLKDNKSDRWTGPWINVWGVESKFDDFVFIKNQYVFDTNKNELLHNYRFTEAYHKILNQENEIEKKKLSENDQKKVELFEI